VRKLFGTDGIRGKAGEPPLDEVTVSRLGMALGRTFSRAAEGPSLLIGRDTRESGAWIEEALSRGFRAAGGTVSLAGVIPTPAVAGLVRSQGFQGGVVISASHNPFRDNGIKVFSASGFKLPDTEEAELEQLLEDCSPPPPGENGSNGTGQEAEYRDAYLDSLRGSLIDDLDFAGIHVVLDCANGAASGLAAELFGKMGARVSSTSDEPNGVNINLDCGSLHPEKLGQRVMAEGADLGIAFDGDADRALFVDHRGRLIDGDHVLYLCGVHLRDRGILQDSHIVTTVMANIGLQLALDRQGITMERTQVGDKYVLERMVESNAMLGGEQSGHIIFLHRATTGDGMLTGLKVIEVMAATGRSLAELVEPVIKYPQVLLNLKVASKPAIETLPEVTGAIKQVETELAGKGRVVVRYSGTENLARVMVEGPAQELIQQQAQDIVEALEHSIG